ncbi:DUF4124 domain-containing protein [Allofranklinella schreckenbergeri]|uniref:DUF4124 domain-containing protein n=1 Tax=Allofranklinella schreckenbergeri TaxID=1076744 RepID=A0A3M6PXF3_9BURK|nr:DUF4124 domain-containing protein [Allofranklinella schreckenbergeri]RMW95416.1 DUF4124 domain-containing protein [Allofranklinella schreckenbergeri]RMW96924.1 DUF4124 domain-containing protein [Allofranklinella schreckenbergeri]
MFKPSFRIFFAAIALSLAGAASAQWQWVDDSGRKVYSDTPPPAHIPQNRILRAPGKGTGNSLKPAATTAAPASDSTPTEDSDLKAKVDAADNAQQQEQAKKQEAIDKKNAEIDRKNAEIERQNRATLCNSARIRLDQLTSGKRLSTVDQKGNVGFMNDAQREAERKRAQEDIRKNC